jgi:hypothetical protein
MAEAQEESFLDRIHKLEQELEHLKRDVLQQLSVPSAVQPARKPSLFGCVRSGEISEELIEEAKRHLFRPLEDL